MLPNDVLGSPSVILGRGRHPASALYGIRAMCPERDCLVVCLISVFCTFLAAYADMTDQEHQFCANQLLLLPNTQRAMQENG